MASFNKKTENNTQLYSRETLKRIVADIKQIKKNPLDSEGVYYEHDDENLLKGYALVIGPEDTPYAYGHYFFTFDFPNNYPHSPPRVTFHNWGDNIRFNPNLYRTGKVCLSILNTWRGEGWTSCQTLTTILLTLCTVLNEQPLLNEPGITANQEQAIKNYNNIISYKNIELSIIKCANMFKEFLPTEFHSFLPYVEENIKKNKDNIQKSINKLSESIGNEQTLISSHYNMQVNINCKKINLEYKHFK